ncbi:uncharacterized protein LOC5574698 [Aedes aegypti]|uniref:Chitin-binding type-2 domain-containing protein n=1 Tax=Aedes aegypti TaxID=7159 RepID=A0A1S4FT91_AEDAE|nr:uncharacterized protein LOC5574698 [Aedes aegypti]
MWWKFIATGLLVIAARIAAQDPGQVEFDCSSVLTYAFFSLEANCSRFVFCNNTEAKHFECGGDEIWSQANGACVLGDQETCEEWTLKNACGNNTDDRLVSYPRDCGKYIQCGEDEVKVLECEPGMIFSELRSQCFVGSLKECELLENVCDGRENDYVTHPERCDVAIMCDKEEITTELCSEGDIFSEEFQICVPGNSKTCQPLPLEEMCVNRTDQVLLHPDRCQSYVQCQNGVSIEKDCSRGTIFHPRNMSCVVGKVGDGNSCELLDEICTNSIVGELREHSDEFCDIFVECLEDEIPRINFCGTGRIWSQRWLLCIPGNTIGCVPSSLETICDNQQFGAIFPHPEDCSMIVSCNLTHANEIACPENHIVQPGTLGCILGDPNTCKSLDEMCANQMDLSISFPEDCERFVRCRNENPSLEHCAPGEIFIETLQKCTPGNTESCLPLTCETGFTRHPNYCNLYFDCQAGQVNVNMCPYQLIWHEHLWRCTPGSDCVYDPLDTMCIGRFNGDVFPYPTNDNSCDTFVTCANGEAWKETCPSGMILRQQILDCVPGDDQTCRDFDMSCTRESEWVEIHPTRCNIRIICMLGELSTRECPVGQIVDEELLICVPGTCPETNPIDTICSGRPDGELVPDLDQANCVNYYECLNGLPIANSCPEGRIFQRLEKICAPGIASRCEDLRDFCRGRPNGAASFPEDGKCNIYLACNGDTTDVRDCPAEEIFIDGNTGVCVPGFIPECTRLPLETMCQGRADQLEYPHPDDCSSYVTCLNNQASVDTCERGNIYSGINSQCLAGDSCVLFNGCAGQANGIILLHPTSSLCDLYVECVNGLPETKECPQGQIITSETGNVCVPGDSSTCSVTLIGR